MGRSWRVRAVEVQEFLAYRDVGNCVELVLGVHTIFATLVSALLHAFLMWLSSVPY
jgi:hypothetical protein